jgi:glucosamine--fructose-6-phosphate aminotransferase (isomerizing)
LVHNGILENHAALRARLEARGIVCQTETDTEVAAQWLAAHYDGDLLSTLERCIQDMEGSFAFAVISSREPGVLVGARRGSPLAVGIGAEALLLASDAVPILPFTRQVLYLEDNQVVRLADGKVTLRGMGHLGCGGGRQGSVPAFHA